MLQVVLIQKLQKINLVILGGSNGTRFLVDILQFDPTTNQWEEAGQMKKERRDHAVSLIPLDEAQKLCV